jgi:hypothetical protein
MAIRWDEFKANFKHYEHILPDNEPIVLPRREAARRAVNKEKRTKVQFDCTPEQYAAFHLQRKRYIELVGNVTIAYDVMTAILKAVENETVRALAEQPHSETLGDA